MSREPLKPGDVEGVENTEVPGEFFAMGLRHDSETDAEADAAQINAALAVVERVKAMRNQHADIINEYKRTGVLKGSKLCSGDVLKALAVILEPDDAARARLPGAEWLSDNSAATAATKENK